MNALLPGPSNPLLSFDLRPGLGASALALPLIIWMLCLAYGAWCDIYRGRIIPNTMTVPLIISSWAIMPLLYQDPIKQAVIALLISLLFTALWFIGAFAGGDWKLYLASAPLLGLAAFPAMIISFLIIIIYSIPVSMATMKESSLTRRLLKDRLEGAVPEADLSDKQLLIWLGRGDEDKVRNELMGAPYADKLIAEAALARKEGLALPARGERLGVVPAGPGIALSIPCLLAFAGVSLVYCGLLALIQLMAVVALRTRNQSVPE